MKYTSFYPKFIKEEKKRKNIDVYRMTNDKMLKTQNGKIRDDMIQNDTRKYK